MSLNVIIPPKWAAKAVAQSSEARDQSTNNALVLDLFCDGSFKHRPPRAGIGVVTNMWLPHTTKKQRTSKACFIPCGFRYKDDDNNTTEAFALAEGAHVALDQITYIKKDPSIRSMDKIEVTFWSDSKLVLTALGSSARARLLSKKMQHILDIIKLKTQELHELVENVSVQFRRCPEECVEPHALADRLSKGARMSGRSMYSKALTLFHGVSHSKIQSALGQSRATATDTAPAQSSSLGAGGAGSSFVEKAAKFQNSALRPITRDPVIINVLYRAAGSSRFFSIVGGMVECLPSNLRRIMHEAIREQQDANKKFQRHAQDPSDEGNVHHEPSSTSLYPNLFALIEITASRLPAVHQKKIVAAIKLQKEANAHLVQNEVVGQVYQFEGDYCDDMNHEPEKFEEPKAQQSLMSFETPEDAE